MFVLRAPHDIMEEERRRRREAREAAMSGTTNALGSALAQMQKLGEQKEVKERQAKLDAEQSAMNAATLKFREADAKRADENQARLRLQDTAAMEDRARMREGQDQEKARLVLKDYVAAGRAAGRTPEEIARMAHDVPALGAITGDEEVYSAFAEQQAGADAGARAAVDAARKAAIEEREQVRKERDSAATRAKAYADAKAAGQPKEVQPKPMGEAVVGKVAAYDAQLSTLDDLIKRKETVNLGPIDSKINSISQMLGADDATTTKYRADVASVMNGIISQLSGANVPEGEMERLRAGLPTDSDNDDAFETKLRATRDYIRNMRRSLVNAEQAAGRTGPGSSASATPGLDAYLGGG